MRTQLINFKEAKYGNSQISLLLNADQLQEKMRLSLSMETTEFVVMVLGRVLSNSTSSSRDFNNFSTVMNAFPSSARTYIKLLSDSPNNSAVLLLGDLIDQFITSDAEAFPKKAAGLSTAEVQFQRGLMQYKRIYVGKWIELHDSTGLDMTQNLFGRLGQFLYMVMYHEWTHAAVDCKRPPVTIPGNVKLNKHALPVIYYVAEWTLFSAS